MESGASPFWTRRVGHRNGIVLRTTIGLGAALGTLVPILIAGEWKGVSSRSKFVFWGLVPARIGHP
jgi:hypothetical protein